MLRPRRSVAGPGSRPRLKHDAKPVKPNTTSTPEIKKPAHPAVLSVKSTKITRPIAYIPRVASAYRQPKPVPTPGVSKERPTFSVRFSLPSFRPPPGSGELPSHIAMRWVLIVAFGLVFFIIGYHNLWHWIHV